MKPEVVRYSMIVLLMCGLTAVQANARCNFCKEIELISTSWGVAAGQTARISLVNFPGESVRSSFDPIVARLQLLDMEGAVIAQSDEIGVPPGQFRFWDVPRESLAVPGERGTGRLQVQLRILVETGLPDRHGLPLLPTVELIDNITGKTEVWIPFREIGYLSMRGVTL